MRILAAAAIGTITVLLLTTGPASAQKTSVQNNAAGQIPTEQIPTGQIPTEQIPTEQIYVISEADCRLLSRHIPEPGVAYEPGVDVRGRPVAPADLGGRRPLKVPDAFIIDIDVFLADRLGIPPDRKLFRSEANVAYVAVDGDQVTFNGQPLGDLRQLAIADACRKKLDPVPRSSAPK